MNKKFMICIIIFVVLIILFNIGVRKKVKNNSGSTKNGTIITNTLKLKQVEITGEIVVYDEETGEEIARGYDETDLYIYTIDPNYNPKFPVEENNKIN